ncbi:MAG TPA: hypothetical protein VFF03_17975 [Rhodocyclaceae bacterium]|nr:hypothetical protein [Rhodocyclaceae bacterium]
MNERLRSAWSTVVFTLIVIGIGGLSWSAFQENGWVEQTFGVIWDAEVRHPMLLVPTIGGALLMASIYLRGGLAPGKNSVVSALLTYGMMIAGVYYCIKWIFW